MRDTTTDGPEWDALRARLDHMRALAGRSRLSLVELAKAYQALAGAMLQVATASGQTSARFEAVVRALDLTTPKSALEAFLERRR